jgi:hypothetical protein
MPTDEEAEDEPEDDQGDDANNSGQEALGKGDSAVMKTCLHVAGVHIDVVKNTLLDPSLWSCRGSSTTSHYYHFSAPFTCATGRLMALAASMGAIKLINAHSNLPRV